MGEVHLGVNVDHVATLRQARRVSYPSVVEAALAAERGGAAGITAHLREDRRHIQDDDITALAAAIATKLNFEMAATDEMIGIACRVRPRDVCLVPEKREELTTEGGLDVRAHLRTLTAAVGRLREAGIRVSLFIDPHEDQIEASVQAGAEAVEIHTGTYAEVGEGPLRDAELARIERACAIAAGAGLLVNAGHGLTLDNVAPIAAIPQVFELNIGHSLVADAVFVGLEEAVRRMKARMQVARGGR